MKLDGLTVNVRPLPPYKALDLGFAIARAWFLSLWGLWFKAFFSWVFVVVLAIFIFSAVRTSDIYAEVIVGILFLWLSKPVFELNLLIYLSQKLFDNKVRASDIDALEPLSFGQTFSLVASKFSTQRTLKMAVTHLEGQLGKAGAARLRVLTRGGGNALVAQLIMFWIIEFVLVVGGWLFLVDMLSFDVLGYEKANWIFEAQQLPTWFLLLCFLIYVLTVSVLAPFFVASGFALYVCRRSHLEGWDIELAFRHLAKRYKNSKIEDNR